MKDECLIFVNVNVNATSHSQAFVNLGPLRPAPAHPIHRVPRGWLSAHAGEFTFTFTNTFPPSTFHPPPPHPAFVAKPIFRFSVSGAGSSSGNSF